MKKTFALWAICFVTLCSNALFAYPIGTATLFALGQGGSIVLNAHKEPAGRHIAVMVDAGSSESSYTTRQLAKHPGTGTDIPLYAFHRPDTSLASEEDPFDDDDDGDDVEEAATMHVDSPRAGAGASSSHDVHMHSPASPGTSLATQREKMGLSLAASTDSLETHSSQGHGVDVEALKRARSEAAAVYKNTVIHDIQLNLAEKDRIVVFVTHPDKDHYNEIPAIFDAYFMESFASKQITFVFSGFEEQYTVGFPTWLAAIRALRNPRIEIIFTGLEDPSKAGSGIQPRYRSSAAPRTATEAQIQALIEEIKTDYGLKIDILSLNTGVEPGMSLAAASAAKLKNTNSLVMRASLVTFDASTRDFKELENSSILIPGDAEGDTWAYVLEDSTGEDRVRHMVLSHHGSSSHEALTDALLVHFQPQTFYLSNGRYNGYRHPDEVGMMVLSTYLQKNSHVSTDVHRLSYYPTDERKKLSRSWTPAPIFSTLNNGTITIKLHDSSHIHVSTNKEPIFHVSGTAAAFKIVGGPTIVPSHSYPPRTAKAHPTLWERAHTSDLEVAERAVTLTDAVLATLRTEYPAKISLQNFLVREGPDGHDLIYPLEQVVPKKSA